MEIFDAHVHVDARGFEDLRTLALLGTREVTTCAHDALPFSCAESVLDHFARLLDLDCYRLRQCGIKPHVALGVHPRGIPKKGFDLVVQALPALLGRQEVVAVGEIGLHYASQEELDVFRQQIELAKSLDLPCIVHTPEKNKLTVTREAISVVEEMQISRERVVIDHVNEETFGLVKDSGCWVGLSVHPGKLSELRAASLVQEFGSERIMFNSDVASALSDIMALPKAILEMRKMGVAEADVGAVVRDNAVRFYKLEVAADR